MIKYIYSPHNKLINLFYAEKVEKVIFIPKIGIYSKTVLDNTKYLD